MTLQNCPQTRSPVSEWSRGYSGPRWSAKENRRYVLSRKYKIEFNQTAFYKALDLTPRSESSSTGTSNSSGASLSASLPEGSLRKSFSQLETKWTQSLRSKPPTWTRGHPNIYIDVLTIPQPPTDKEYQYRIVKGDRTSAYGLRMRAVHKLFTWI